MGNNQTSNDELNDQLRRLIDESQILIAAARRSRDELDHMIRYSEKLLIESARLLLNSTSTLFPNGLANGSGAVGKYLTDTLASSAYGYVPALEGVTP